LAQFPALKTGAVAQYPSDRTRRFSTLRFRFVDGTEQRFPGHATVLKRWTLRLDLLDDAELHEMGEFLATQGGRAGTFSFTDPFDGIVYANCSFEQDEIALEYLGASGGRVVVRIKENKS